MDRLSQQALAELSEAFLHAGTTDVRDMEALSDILVLLRGRVRPCLNQTEAAEQRASLLGCLAPLGQWMMAEQDLEQLPIRERSDLLWNIYTAALSRTAGAEAFDRITGDEQAWHDMAAELFRQQSSVIRRGGQATSTVVHSGTPWHLYMMLTGLCTLLLDQWLLSGRMRFYASALGTVLVGGGLLWTFWPGDRSTMDSQVVATGESSYSRSLPTHGGTRQGNAETLHNTLGSPLVPRLLHHLFLLPRFSLRRRHHN